MTAKQIKDYRRLLEKEYTEKDNEIDTHLMYINFAALGFFLTINEKFLKIQDADYLWLIGLSLGLLLVSFVLIITRKGMIIRGNHLLMRFIDKMSVNSRKHDKAFDKLWGNNDKKLTIIRRFVYFILSFGIGFQILFFLLNLYRSS